MQSPCAFSRWPLRARGRASPTALLARIHPSARRNIHVVTPHYLAGGQPSERGYRWLKSKGVTTVLNLRQSSAHEKEMLERMGLRYVHVAWPDLQPPKLEQVRRIVEVVQAEQKRGGKVFQHCLRGIGRDDTMVCRVRVASGVPAEKAIAEWIKAAPT